MNGFLVLLRHTTADLPVALFANGDDAIRECDRIAAGDGMPTEEIRDIYGTECASPVEVVVVEFRDGTPVASDGNHSF